MDPLTSISIGAKALGLLKRFWYVLPILAMAAFIYFQSARIAGKDDQLARARVTQTQLEDRNRLVQASLDASVARIKDNNARIEAGAKALAEQRAQSAADLARLQERYTKTAATVKALEASAKRAPADPCKVSDLATAALKDL